MTNANSTAVSKEFVPQEEWPAVTAMLAGFGSPTLLPSDKLEGTELDINYDSGERIVYVFADGLVSVAGAASPYRAVEVREEIFYIDYLVGEGAQQTDFTMILNRVDGRVTVAESSFVDRAGSVRMKTDIHSGRVAKTGDIQPRRRSEALIGKRIFYRYSETEKYEHIYLNGGTFVWHCVQGGEVGLADVDPIQVFELADDVVLLHWSETVMPVESFVVIDLQHSRSIGRMYCWDGPTLAPMHLPFDSAFTVLNDTDYPRD